MSAVVVDDPAGTLPTETEALLSAYFATLSTEAAAGVAGVTLARAEKVLADPSVKPITAALWDAFLAYIAEHGRRLGHDADAAESRFMDDLAAGRIDAGGMSHDDWILSGRLDGSGAIENSAVTAASA